MSHICDLASLIKPKENCIACTRKSGMDTRCCMTGWYEPATNLGINLWFLSMTRSFLYTFVKLNKIHTCNLPVIFLVKITQGKSLAQQSRQLKTARAKTWNPRLCIISPYSNKSDCIKNKNKAKVKICSFINVLVL